MKAFVDTSVLIAAFWSDHVHHHKSAPLIDALTTVHAAVCAAHTVAEVYSVITRLPLKPPIPAQEAHRLVRLIREKVNVVSLTTEEYFETVERLAAKGLAKNYIYDGLIVTAALKCGAHVIYTWDVDDFIKVAPSELIPKIRTP